MKVEGQDWKKNILMKTRGYDLREYEFTFTSYSYLNIFLLVVIINKNISTLDV